MRSEELEGPSSCSRADDDAHSISRDSQVVASDAWADEREPIPRVWCSPPPAPPAGLFRRDLSCSAAAGHWRGKMSQCASLSRGGLAVTDPLAAGRPDSLPGA